MILLDTDHLTVAAFPGDARFELLRGRIEHAVDSVAATVISLEEHMRGWLSAIARRRNVRDQIDFYRRLADMVQFFARWEIAPWEALAASEFERLRKLRVRIGTQDLKIASIALANDALLLSANLRDFRQVQGLRVENWLRPSSDE